MTKRMLVDASHPEETRVAIVESYRDTVKLQDLDSGLASKPVLRGNIYLAKVVRIEPALQAAFVDYGGNRHGFLPFSEIHPDYYFRTSSGEREQEQEQIQEQEQQQAGQPADMAPHFEAFQPELPPEPESQPQAQFQEEPPLLAEETPYGGFAAESRPDFSSAPEIVSTTEAYSSPIESRPADFSSSLPSSTSPLPLSGMEDNASAEHDVGLITNFGHSVDPMPPVYPAEGAGAEFVPQMETSVESVGGDPSSERVIRQPRQRYKIQDVLKRGQIMLVQVVKEERGNKGAALTSFLSLAGRYCVLMPNTDHGGGVSRKITSHQDRRRMKDVLDQLQVPEGMAVILRTAGMEQQPPDIQRDLEYLMRLWDNIREQTLQSTAPTLIYEEANLIKRAVRDLYSQDIAEILVSGTEGYERARDFMRTIMPDDVEKIRLYQDPIPLFFRYQVETQIDTLHSPIAQLRSGGYLVINPTEALVSIDVNSGRSTRERHIEETALKTNLEAADEVARQLRLRDLAGLVVIDFIDMEDNRNNMAVERRLKEAMKNDRARLQIGRISPFGLMELSRQRLRPSLLETNFEKCPHCSGIGHVRSVDSAALSILRAIEEEGIRQRSAELVLHVPTKVALYILNQKRNALGMIEQRYDMHVLLHSDDTLVPPDYRIERSRNYSQPRHSGGPAVNADKVFAEAESEIPAFVPKIVRDDGEQPVAGSVEGNYASSESAESEGGNGGRGSRNRRGGRYGRGGRDRRPPRSPYDKQQASTESGAANDVSEQPPQQIAEGGVPAPQAEEGDWQQRRRRGRRGGRRRNGGEDQANGQRFSRNGGGSQQRVATADEVPPPMAAAAFAPFEIDTTPRPPREDPPRREPSPHEIVNPSPEKPKGGWWHRLTGGSE